MEDNTEIAEEMSLGNLNHIPKRKLLAFFWTEKKLSSLIWKAKIYFS